MDDRAARPRRAGALAPPRPRGDPRDGPRLQQPGRADAGDRRRARLRLLRSFGLLAYDFAGKEVWRHPLETPPTKYGTASSPIVRGEHVIVQRDGNSTASELRAVDRRTGRTAWTAARPTLKESYSTPMLWAHPGGEDLITVGNGRVTAYDPANGRERWSANGSHAPAGGAGRGRGRAAVRQLAGWRWRRGRRAGVVRSGPRPRRQRRRRSGYRRSAGDGGGPSPEGGPARRPRELPLHPVHPRGDRQGQGRHHHPGRMGRLRRHAGRQPEQRPRLASGRGRRRHRDARGLEGPAGHPRDAVAAPLPGPPLVRARRGNASRATSRRRAAWSWTLSGSGREGQYAASPVGAGGADLHRERGRDDHGARSPATASRSSPGTNWGNGSLATPAIGRDTLYVRTEKHLWAFR